MLLDEPTEHLDAADADPMLRDLLGPNPGLMAADRDGGGGDSPLAQ